MLHRLRGAMLADGGERSLARAARERRGVHLDESVRGKSALDLGEHGSRQSLRADPYDRV